MPKLAYGQSMVHPGSRMTKLHHGQAGFLSYDSITTPW